MAAHRTSATEATDGTGKRKGIRRTLLRMFPRAMGVITVGYALYVLAYPEAMTGPTALSSGEPDAGLATLTRSMLVRDLACGAAMIAVPAGWPLLTALGIRVASDLGDAVIMGTSLPTAEARGSAIAVAGVFAALCALSAFGARRSSGG